MLHNLRTGPDHQPFLTTTNPSPSTKLANPISRIASLRHFHSLISSTSTTPNPPLLPRTAKQETPPPSLTPNTPTSAATNTHWENRNPENSVSGPSPPIPSLHPQIPPPAPQPDSLPAPSIPVRPAQMVERARAAVMLLFL